MESSAVNSSALHYSMRQVGTHSILILVATQSQAHPRHMILCWHLVSLPAGFLSMQIIHTILPYFFFGFSVLGLTEKGSELKMLMAFSGKLLTAASLSSSGSGTSQVYKILIAFCRDCILIILLQVQLQQKTQVQSPISLASHLSNNHFHQMINIMGTSQSITSRLTRYNVQYFQGEHWQRSNSLLKRTSSTVQLHSAEEYQLIISYSSERYGFMVNEYQLDCDDSLDVLQLLKEIDWRNRCEYLVNVRFVSGFAERSVCNTHPNSNFLYIQHIPLRLSQITDIPFPQNLYLLKACLTGFHYIYLQEPNLDIREEQICISPEGRAKVWMNANLSKHSPHAYNIFKSGKKSELTLVNDVINIIDENTDHQFQPKSFKEYLEENRLLNLSFAEAIQALHNFAMLLHVRIPICLDSVNVLFSSSEDHRNIVSAAQSSTVRYNNDANETTMVQSVPRHQEYQPYQHFNPFIKHANTYSVSMTNSQPYTPFEPQMQYTPQYRPNAQINFVFRTVQRTEEGSHNDYALSQFLSNMRNKTMPASQPTNNAQQQWKYFNSEGWQDINPEILIDLKKIATHS